MPRTVQELLPTNDSFEVSGLAIKALAKCPSVKKEYIKQISRLKDLGMNAMIVRIGPTADAIYPSAYEPWSEFLTGEQGQFYQGFS